MKDKRLLEIWENMAAKLIGAPDYEDPKITDDEIMEMADAIVLQRGLSRNRMNKNTISINHKVNK